MQVNVELHDQRNYSFVGVSKVQSEGTKWVIYGDAGIVVAVFEKNDVKSLTTQ